MSPIYALSPARGMLAATDRKKAFKRGGGTLQTHRRSGCAILVLLLISTTSARARPMHVMSSTPAAEAIMHGRNAQYVVRFDGPVDHAQSRLEILRDGHVVQHLNPLLDSAADVLFASAPARAGPLRASLDREVGPRPGRLRGG